MDFWYDVAINLFAGLVAGVVSSGLTFAYVRALEWRRARRLWRLTDAARLTVIVSTSEAPRRHLPGSSRLGTGVGQLRGVALLAPSLIRAYGQRLRPEMVLLSAQAEDEDTRGDLVLLGGPRTNAVVAKVCESEVLPVYMRDAAGGEDGKRVDSRIHWRPHGGAAETFETADECDWAYGMVLRHPNVLDPPGARGRLWMIAGSSTWGTQAAAEWLSSNQKLVRRAKGTAAYVVRAELKGTPASGIRTPVLHRSVSYG